MFDDLRSQVTPFDDDGEPTAQPQRAPKAAQPSTKTGAKTASAQATTMPSARTATGQVATSKRVVRKKKKAGEVLLLGMTSVQRFVLAMMMFMIVAVFGLVVLLVMGKVVLM